MAPRVDHSRKVTSAVSTGAFTSLYWARPKWICITGLLGLGQVHENAHLFHPNEHSSSTRFPEGNWSLSFKNEANGSNALGRIRFPEEYSPGWHLEIGSMAPRVDHGRKVTSAVSTGAFTSLYWARPKWICITVPEVLASSASGRYRSTSLIRNTPPRTLQ